MRANFATHCSTGARRAWASPTMRIILANTVSEAAFVARTVSVPSPLIVPA